VVCAFVGLAGFAAVAPSASARRAATVRLPARFTPYDRFAGPVLLMGAPVWAQHDRDGRWRIYRAARRRAKLKTLPAGGTGHLFHPVRLSASGRSLAIVDTSYEVLYPRDEEYATRVDRLLLGGLDQPFVQLAGCGYGANDCASHPPCGIYALPSWWVSVGDGTVAWIQACPGPVELDARRTDGGPLLLRSPRNPPFEPFPALAVASGDFVALLESDRVIVWNLSTGTEHYRVAPPSGDLLVGCAVQSDGTIAVETSANPTGVAAPYRLAWASPAEPFLHPLPGSPVAQVLLNDNRLLFAEGPEFGPQRALVLEQIPKGDRRILTNFGPRARLPTTQVPSIPATRSTPTMLPGPHN